MDMNFFLFKMFPRREALQWNEELIVRWWVAFVFNVNTLNPDSYAQN